MADLTFSHLYKDLTKQGSLTDIKDDFKLLFELGACFLTPAESTGLNAFFSFMSGTGVATGKRIIELFKSGKPVSFSERVLRMRETYAAICFTAFFDTLASELPRDIKDKIQLRDTEKKSILKSADNCKITEKNLNRRLVLPNLVFNCEKVYEYLEQLYKDMAQRLLYFVSNLEFSDTASEKDSQQFRSVVENLPQHALDSFKNQYLMLCADCPEFYIYIQLGKEQEIATDMEEKYQKLLSVATRTEAALTQGLRDFQSALVSAQATIKNSEVREITEQLLRSYRSMLEEDVVETHDDEQLKFPTIEDAFIPQRFRLLPYTGKERLEQPDTWRDLEPVEDMDAFWAKYALAAEGTNKLLLILGEPGGGKSLLTKVLAARLGDEGRLCVRIPLRVYAMENNIERMVCRQIEKDGKAREEHNKFKWYAEEFHGEPITLLFDGYDEVQQATGASYHRFLEELRSFQKECFQDNLPVKIVVTSRATLIDKANIPSGTLVMKLDDFDRMRQERWCEIWNSCNHDELERCGLSDFALPEESSEIAELAKQPLLLLMLSMYDADFDNQRNALRQADESGESLNRTQLYHELLRRFIRRELEKGRRGNEHALKEEHDPAKQEALINAEMQKLGIAALGMFAREKLAITVAELETDFHLLRAQLPTFADIGKSTLRNEEIFLGSFFFIHDSRSRGQRSEDETAPDVREPGASFVFLHKTFYEFLVADIVLQSYFDYMLDLVQLWVLVRQKRLGNDHYEATKSALTSEKFTSFFISVGAACLCAEPEILRMIGEWKANKLKDCLREFQSIDENLVPEVIHDVFGAHFKLIRDGAFQKMDTLIPGRTQPQLCAVYLLNTVILEALVCDSFSLQLTDWQFCASYIKLNAPRPKKKPAEPTGKKRRSFSLDPSEELPLQFMALFGVRQADNTVTVELRDRPVDYEKRSLLDARRELFSFAQEETDRLLYTLHDVALSPGEKYEMLRSLNQRGMELSGEAYLAFLNSAILDDRQNTNLSLDFLLDETERLLRVTAKRNPTLLHDWLLKLQYYVQYFRPQIFNRTKDNHSGRERWILRSSDRITWRIVDSLAHGGGAILEQCLMLWTDILKTIGYVDSVFNVFLHDHGPLLIENLSGECFYAIVKAFPTRQISLKDGPRYDNLINIFSREGIMRPGPTHSPKWYAALLSLFGKYARTEHYIFSVILRNFSSIESFRDFSELPVMLREFLRLGGCEEVSDYLHLVDIPYSVMNERTPAMDALAELLEIEEIVGGNRLKEQLGEYLIEPMMYDFRNANACRLALRVARRFQASRAQQRGAERLLVEILERYDYVFCADPDAAVSLLNELFARRVAIPNEDLISRAVSFSLRYDSSQLSVPVFAKLLITASKMNRAEWHVSELNLENSYLRLLNAALSKGDRRIDALLEKTLHSFSVEVQDKLQPALWLRIRFIERIFPGLANSIKRLRSGDTVLN